MLPHLCNISLDVLVSAVRKEREMKVYGMEREAKGPSLLMGITVCSTQKSQGSMQVLFEEINFHRLLCLDRCIIYKTQLSAVHGSTEVELLISIGYHFLY